MRVFFISDIHLSDGTTAAARRFVSFLKEVPKAGDILVLGGDIFDLFVGNKRIFRQKFANVLGAIRETAKNGTTVYYLEGNHDFHLGAAFAKTPHFHFREDDFSFQFGGKSFYVSHGDLIDPEDKGYRLLRAVTKNDAFRLFVKAIPNTLVDKIGNWSSRHSRKYTRTEGIGNEKQQRIRKLYLDFAKERVRLGADFVLIGHSHLRDQISIGTESGRQKGEYINLGFSASDLPYGLWQEGAKSFELKHYP
ncbi:MAG: UDP-2,3-diacylglucosamine diphosphatase [Bdellovibrionota bacterium]